MAEDAVHKVLPFPAVVGQEQLKLALLMLAVNPRLQGLLIRGEKGTAKSTAARAMARLLPLVEVVQGCRFGCPKERPIAWCSECRERGEVSFVERRPPFETLPLGITSDQLLGTIDLEHALRRGERRFAPGLLARVNEGVLYVDEVNLLDDHIVDLMLDAAAMGVNVVAREGISMSHPAEFILIGTMNPEEGGLRPQLLDRFGLCVDIRGLEDPEERAEIVVRRLAFEADPEGFDADWCEAERSLTEQIASARARLARAEVDRRWCVAAAHLSLSLGVAGHRADVLMVKGAATLAALEGRTQIGTEDLERAATVVLPHRLKRRPFEEQTLTDADIRDRARDAARAVLGSAKKKARRRRGSGAEPVAESDREQHSSPAIGHDRHLRSGTGSPSSEAFSPDGWTTGGEDGLLSRGLWGSGDPEEGPTADLKALEALREVLPSSRPSRVPTEAPGRRRKGPSRPSRQRFRGTESGVDQARETPRDLAWDATLRAVAPLQRRRKPPPGLAISIESSDLLEKRRSVPPGRLTLLVVDASGSMGGELTALAKRVALAILREAYVKRERVAMVAFRERSAELVFPPTNEVECVHRSLGGLPLGGTTPLAAGLELAHVVLTRTRLRDPSLMPTLVLVSDGRANVGSRPGYEKVLAELEEAARQLTAVEDLTTVFLDTTDEGQNDLRARELAHQLRARRVELARIRRTGVDPAEHLTGVLNEMAAQPVGGRA